MGLPQHKVSLRRATRAVGFLAVSVRPVTRPASFCGLDDGVGQKVL
jgi:hypothetical protein